MIGFYNYSVILTYIGLISSLIGMTFAADGRMTLAICCLAFSGFCDMFDGKIARAMKNRTEDEKRFGIQIDSLCDVVCFGAFPTLIGYCTGMRGIIGRMILAFYGTSSVIRLGYFNVMEEKRQEETDEVRKTYEGMPITTIALVLPLLFMLNSYVGEKFVLILHVVMLLAAALMILRFEVKKPDNKTLAVFVGLGIIAVLRVMHII